VCALMLLRERVGHAFSSIYSILTPTIEILETSTYRPPHPLQSAAHDAATQHLSKLPATTDTPSPLRPLTLA
jgi:hypothetical protein